MLSILGAARPQPLSLSSATVATKPTSWWQNPKTRPKALARLSHKASQPSLSVWIPLCVFLVLAYQLSFKGKLPSSQEEEWSTIWCLSKVYGYHLFPKAAIKDRKGSKTKTNKQTKHSRFPSHVPFFLHSHAATSHWLWTFLLSESWLRQWLSRWRCLPPSLRTYMVEGKNPFSEAALWVPHRHHGIHI